MAALEQAHRSQADTTDPPRAGVSSYIVGGDRRAAEDELTRQSAVVGSAPDVIPDTRLELPLVDQARRFAGEVERRVDACRRSSLVVDVEKSLARCDLSRGECLSARLWSFEDDDRHRSKPRCQFAVDDTRPVTR
jgi:hypothetical protein